jgi:stage IV sporulation protein FB
MKDPEVHSTRFDLHWRCRGTSFRITPLFLVSCAILGVRYYVDPEAGSFGWGVFWMVAVVLSVLAHEMGHVLAGWIFGLRGDVILSGLGGVIQGVSTLPQRWQRIVVLLAGPLVQIVIVAGIVGLPLLPFPSVLRRGGLDFAIANGMSMVFWINLDWAVLNLLPIWPLDGGRIAAEIGEGLFGPRGAAWALGASIVTCGILAIGVSLELSLRLSNPYDPHYILYLERFTVLLLFCFLFWVRGFRDLWPEEQAVPR